MLGAIHNQESALGLLHRLKMSYKRLKIGPKFLQLFINSTLSSLPGFINGDQQAELNQILPDGRHAVAIHR